MKLLFDQNLSFKLVENLAGLFPGSAQVKALGLDQASDAEIWDFARQQGFLLVTKDADFYERSTLLGHPPKVIWLRCGNQPTRHIERLIRSHLDGIREFERNSTASCLEIY